jgi:hypothetical protein
MENELTIKHMINKMIILYLANWNNLKNVEIMFFKPINA